MMTLLIAMAAGLALGAGPAAPPQKEIEGTIEKALVGMDREGPRLVVKAEGGEEWTVWLGSFRYLMAQDFNPKAGQRVKVSGFERGEREMMAAKVTVRETGRTLVLRGPDGRPVWRGQGKQK